MELVIKNNAFPALIDDAPNAKLKYLGLYLWMGLPGISRCSNIIGAMNIR